MSSEARNKIRAATVGAPKQFKKELITYNGVEIEIRQPSLKVRKSIGERATQNNHVDLLEFLVWAVIECTFVPGTDEKVFEIADYEGLISQPTDSFMDEIGEKAASMCNIIGTTKNLKTSARTNTGKGSSS